MPHSLIYLCVMKIDFGVNVLLYFAAVSVGIYSAIILLSSAKNKLPNRLLGLLMLAITGWIVDALMRASGIYGQYPSLYFLPIYYSFAFGPLLYLYVLAITNKNFHFKKKYALHFVPVVIQGLFYWVVTFQSYQFKYYTWFHIHQPYTYRVEYDGTWLSMVIYLTLAIVHVNKYQLWLQNNYSNTTQKMLNWLKISLGILALVCIAWLFEAYLRDFRNTYYQYDLSTNLLCLVIYCIGFIGIKQVAVDLVFVPDENQVISPKAIAKADDRIVASIENILKVEKLYLNPELTIADLAKRLDLPAKTVSFNINAAFNKPFNSYINAFRVDEVKARLQSSDVEKFTLLGIAFESGFNSKTSFNRIFKEFTGSSPSDFIKK